MGCGGWAEVVGAYCNTPLLTGVGRLWGGPGDPWWADILPLRTRRGSDGCGGWAEVVGVLRYAPANRGWVFVVWAGHRRWAGILPLRTRRGSDGVWWFGPEVVRAYCNTPLLTAVGRLWCGPGDAWWAGILPLRTRRGSDRDGVGEMGVVVGQQSGKPLTGCGCAAPTRVSGCCKAVTAAAPR